MSRKGKIPGNERIAAVETYLRGEDSLRHLAKGLNVSCRAVKQWLQTYQSLGPAGLMNTSTNITYSIDLKQAAVEDYLMGRGSYMELCLKYGIKSTRQLRNWVLKYNGHEEQRSSRIGGKRIMDSAPNSVEIEKDSSK